MIEFGDPLGLLLGEVLGDPLGAVLGLLLGGAVVGPEVGLLLGDACAPGCSCSFKLGSSEETTTLRISSGKAGW